MLHENQILTVMQQMHFNICFSLILHDSKSSQQNTQEKSSQADINNPSLDNTSLVSKDFEHVNQEHYFAALEKEPSHSQKSQVKKTKF